MTIEEQKKYIQDQRAKGVPDDKILSALKTSQQPKDQRGFWGEVLPTAFSVGGGILGGLAGAPGGPVGVAAGGVAGAGAGNALGETIQQGIEKGSGLRDKFNTGQIAASGVIGSATQAAGMGVAKVFSKFAKPAFEASRPTFVRFMSSMSGYADEVLEKALQRTPGAIQGVKDGEEALVDVVKKTAAGISKYAQQTLAESKAKIAEFSKNSVEGTIQKTGGLPGTKASLLDESVNYLRKVDDTLRSSYNIGVQQGKLVFDRATNMSNIVSGGDKSAIQEAYNAIKTIQQNVTIRHIDSVLERLITLRSKTPVGSPTGAETRAIISDMSDSVVDWVKAIPNGYGRGYAQYAQFLDENLPKRIMIQDAKELFGGSENLSPKEVSQITMRLLQIYNTGKLEVRNFADDVGKTIGVDITGTSAGTLINTGDQISVRAPNLTSRGIIEQIVEFLPREVVKSYVANGTITGEYKRSVEIVAKLLGTTEQAILTQIANLTSNKTTE